MTENKVVPAKSSTWDQVKILLTIIPSFSLILACGYYFVFFRNFDGLNLNILTVADYFNKSVEFIPTVALVFLMLTFGLWSYPPRFTGESKEEHYKRIGGTPGMWASLDKLDSLVLKIGIPLSVFMMLLFMPIYHSSQLLPILLLFYVIPILMLVTKHIPTDMQNRIFKRSNIYLGILITMSTVYIYASAQDDAHSIQRETENSKAVLVDIFEAGYLKKQGDELVFSDKNWKEITKVKIEYLGEQSYACSWGLKLICRSEKKTSTTPDQKPTNPPPKTN